MNERIRELAKQAGAHWNHGDFNMGSSIEFQEGDLEKFALLIIKEYEKLLPEICPWADADKEGPMKGWHVAFVARKHFGVEE